MHRIEIDCNTINFSFIGVDVSKKALQIAKKLVASKSEFHTNLNSDIINSYLERNRFYRIDLVIFDRVLVLLSLNEVKNILTILKPKSKYIIVDDFQSSNGMDNGVWKTKDYISLFKYFSFELIQVDKSEHKKTDEFQMSFAKRMVFVSK